MAIFDSQEQRFKLKGLQSYIHQHGTTNKVGPGSYGNLDNTMMKKSFNMSMEHSYFLWGTKVYIAAAQQTLNLFQNIIGFNWFHSTIKIILN